MHTGKHYKIKNKSLPYFANRTKGKEKYKKFDDHIKVVRILPFIWLKIIVNNVIRKTLIHLVAQIDSKEDISRYHKGDTDTRNAIVVSIKGNGHKPGSFFAEVIQQTNKVFHMCFCGIKCQVPSTKASSVMEIQTTDRKSLKIKIIFKNIS